MSGFDEHGFCKPGTIGCGTHVGEPLTAAQIRELPDNAEIVVTWFGGNGPWPYRVLVDSSGRRLIANLYTDELIADWHERPFNRVTLGGDDQSRQWHESKIPEPGHIKAEWGAAQRMNESATPTLTAIGRPIGLSASGAIGELIVMRHADGTGDGQAWITVEHADPRILLGFWLATRIAQGHGHPCVKIYTSCACRTSGDLCLLHLGRTKLEVRARNRKVIYRFTEYRFELDGYILEWPD